MNYSDELIAKARKVSKENIYQYPRASEGFWFEGVYIVSIFMDKTGRKEMSFEESVSYYGEENIAKFMEAVEKHIYHVQYVRLMTAQQLRRASELRCVAF